MKQLEPARDAGDLVRATERTREQAQAAHDAAGTWRLPFWVVFGPGTTDQPGVYIARLWCGRPRTTPSETAIRAATIEQLRNLKPAGLLTRPRSYDDDPNIIETWHAAPGAVLQQRDDERIQSAHDALSRALGPDRVLVIGDADDFGSLMLWTQYPERRRGRQIARALAGLAHAILDQALDPTTNPPGPDGATGAAIRAAKRALDRLDPDHDAESEDAP